MGDADGATTRAGRRRARSPPLLVAQPHLSSLTLMAPSRTFHPFPRLPLELKACIVDFAHENDVAHEEAEEPSSVRDDRGGRAENVEGCSGSAAAPDFLDTRLRSPTSSRARKASWRILRRVTRRGRALSAVLGSCSRLPWRCSVNGAWRGRTRTTRRRIRSSGKLFVREEGGARGVREGVRGARSEERRALREGTTSGVEAERVVG